MSRATLTGSGTLCGRSAFFVPLSDVSLLRCPRPQIAHEIAAVASAFRVHRHFLSSIYALWVSSSRFGCKLRCRLEAAATSVWLSAAPTTLFVSTATFRHVELER
jgi:hypothetical protein